MTAPYIAFEGPDGCGKTTALHNVACELLRRGLRVCVTRQPGGSNVGAALRGILKDPTLHDELTPLGRRLVFLADANTLQQRVIPKARESMDIILCDRCEVVSTKCYGTSEKDGIDLELLCTLHGLAGIEPPDLILLFAVPFSIASQRRKPANGDGTDLAERDDSFFARVYGEYDELVCEAFDSGRIPTTAGFARARVVDAYGTRESTVLNVIKILSEEGMLK